MRNFLNHIKTMKNNEKLLNLAVALNFSFGIRDALSIFKENKRKSELVVRKSSVYFFRIFKMKTFKIKSKEKKSNYLYLTLVSTSFVLLDNTIFKGGTLGSFLSSSLSLLGRVSVCTVFGLFLLSLFLVLDPARALLSFPSSANHKL